MLSPETQKDSHCQVEGHRLVAFNQVRNYGLGSVVLPEKSTFLLISFAPCLAVNFMLSACDRVLYKYTVCYLLTKYAVSYKRLCLETVCRENKM